MVEAKRWQRSTNSCFKTVVGFLHAIICCDDILSTFGISTQRRGHPSNSANPYSAVHLAKPVDLTFHVDMSSAGYEAPVAGEWDEYSRYVVDGVEIPSPVSVHCKHWDPVWGRGSCHCTWDDAYQTTFNWLAMVACASLVEARTRSDSDGDRRSGRGVLCRAAPARGMWSGLTWSAVRSLMRVSEMCRVYTAIVVAPCSCMPPGSGTRPSLRTVHTLQGRLCRRWAQMGSCTGLRHSSTRATCISSRCPRVVGTWDQLVR